MVCHGSLIRKLYYIGIEDTHWLLTGSLHQEATTAVKREGARSEPFSVRQGVRQGGILSTELYKVYLHGCLRRLAEIKGGYHIGEIFCAASSCADDVSAVSNTVGTLQSMVSSAVDYSEMELYLIQHEKSVVLPVNSNSQTARQILLSTLEVSQCLLCLMLCVWESCRWLTLKSLQSSKILRKLVELFT